MTTQSHGASALVIPFPKSAVFPVVQPRCRGRLPRGVIALRAVRRHALLEEKIRRIQAALEFTITCASESAAQQIAQAKREVSHA
jgi:hypothetical protein